ncbi:MAG TPA: condensation domain-containing protein, partial [Blastocatellia bacterium]|nr:condensation domain-containing protein [Blastocatellia bacterium]
RRNAQQTAERFIPDPYSGTPGARMYRTGDVVRYVGGGEIEFIGRVDEQVKVRGYRIELAEVRAAITEQEGVKDAVVMVREDDQRGKRLVGYVVMEEGGSIEQVKSRVKERLPEYMIPSAYVRIEEVPVSRSGKVERARLPEPEWGVGAEEGPKQKARSPIEGILGGIWGEVLGVSEVGVDENFFELGGHSLLVVRIISLVRETLQVEISLRDLFESPTVAGLAALIESAVMKGLTAPPIRKASRDNGVPLSFTQWETLAHARSGVGGPAENVAVCIRFSGLLNLAALEQSITEIVRRHEILRTTFEETDGQILQVTNPPTPFKLDVVDLMNLAEGDPEETALEMTRRATLEPFEEGRVWRARLFRIGKRQHVLSWLMHHFLVDPWSLDVLLRELSILYEAFSHNQPYTLPELSVQYADYTLWQKEWLRGEVFDRHASYWRDKLRGDLERLNLPTDFELPEEQTMRSVSYSFEIPDDLTDAVKDICREFAVTPFMVLLSVLKLLLYKYTNQESILIVSGTANRSRIELEPLIGLFANNIALRTMVSDDLSFKELLMKVRETSLEAYVHQALTLNQIEEVLRAEGWNTIGLRSSVAFGLVAVPASHRMLSDSNTSSVDIEPVPVNTATTAVDLNLTIYEAPAGYSASLIAKADLFKSTTLAKISHDYLCLLQRVVDDPEQLIADLSLASAVEAG